MKYASAWLGAMSTALLVLAGCATNAGRDAVDPQAAAFAAEADAAFDRGDLHAALALADSAERYTPDLPDALYTRGRALNALRRYAEAHDALSSVVARDADYRGAWYHLGHNAFLQRRYREALGYYDRERALVERLLDRARGTPDAPGPQALPTIVAQIGRAYEKMGVPDSARLAYEAALRADSTLDVAHAWLSELYESQGQLEQAFHHARRAAHANPANLEYVYRLGALYLQNGYPGESLPFLGLVAQRWPGHEGAAYNLGRALSALGRDEEAQIYLDRVEAIQRLQDRALQAERGVETYPNDPQRWVALGGLMMEMGYLDRTEQAFQAALALRPGDRTLQNDLANLAAARGDTTAAFQRFRALLRQDSTFADAWLNMGSLYARLGRNDEARAAWRRVLRYHPDDTTASAYLARLP